MLPDHAPKRKPRSSERGQGRQSFSGAEGSPEWWRRSSGREAGVLHHAPAALSGLIMMFALATAAAQEPATPPVPPSDVALAWEGQRERVLELLLEDTRRALAFAPDAQAVPASAEAAAAQPSSAPALSLLALYGVEPHYTVVLDVEGQVRTYRPGASLPLERPDPSREYRLLRVADRCAVLRRGGQRARTVCHAPRHAVEATAPEGALAGPLPWPVR